MKYWILTTLLLIGINSFAQDPTQINKVLKQLNLNESQCKMNLIVSKIRPNKPKETIIVIPEITYEDEYSFDLNSHILLIDSKSSKIKNQFFESSASNGWVSDAIVLTEISIDTAPYYLSNEKRAFGIRVKYYGSSRVNPYSYETISLFEKSNTTLKRLLKNYTVKEFHGEWDGNCIGEFNSQKKVLIISDSLTNSYLNILIKCEITNSKNEIDKNGDCAEKENITRKRYLLKYLSGKYTETVL